MSDARTTSENPAETGNQPPPLSAQFSLGGRGYNLGNLSSDDARAIRDQLPPEKRREIDAIAAVLKDYQSISGLEIPEGFDFEAEGKRYVDALLGGKSLQEVLSDPKLAWIHKNMSILPGYKEFLEGLQMAGGISKQAIDKQKGREDAKKWMDSWFGLRTQYDILTEKLKGEKLTPEQAEIFATTYVTSQFLAERRAEDWNKKQAASVHAEPNVSDRIGGFLQFAMLFIANALSGIAPGFSQWLQKVTGITQAQQASAGLSATPSSPGEFAQAAARSRALGAHAITFDIAGDGAGLFESLGEVAGVKSTAEVTTLVRDGGVMRTQGGAVEKVVRDGAHFAREPLTIKGQQVTVATETSARGGGGKDKSMHDSAAYNGAFNSQVITSGAVTTAGAAGLGLAGYALAKKDGILAHAGEGMKAEFYKMGASIVGFFTGDDRYRMARDEARLEKLKIKAEAKPTGLLSTIGSWWDKAAYHMGKGKLEKNIDEFKGKIAKADAKLIEAGKEIPETTTAKSWLGKSVAIIEETENLGKFAKFSRGAGRFFGPIGVIGSGLAVAGGGTATYNALHKKDFRAAAANGLDTAANAAAVGLLFCGPPGWAASFGICAWQLAGGFVGLDPKHLGEKAYDLFNPGAAPEAPASRGGSFMPTLPIPPQVRDAARAVGDGVRDVIPGDGSSYVPDARSAPAAQRI